ncbi:MAG: hypothetical protein M1292_14990 [Bacteroidetes bacterium]|nr:hypothetical protein [Bacteroidota bacterium]
MCDSSTYQNRVHDFAEKSDPFIFTNDGIGNAVIVSKEIFDHAKENVYIYCGQLNKKLTSDQLYFNSLISFLESGKKLKVLVSEIDGEYSPALQRVIEKSKVTNQVECRYLENNADINSHFTFNGNNNVHFTVADNKSFRIEFDPKEYKAFCSFNNIEISGKLTSIFLKYFDLASPIPHLS